jgi:hypothetical protein
MVDTVLIQNIVSMLTPISLTIGVIYYILTLNNTRKNQQMTLETRQAALYMQYTEATQNLDLIKSLIKVMALQEWEDYDDWDRKYGSKADIDESASFIQICRFYSRLGMIYELNRIDPEIIHVELGRGTIRAWEKLAPLIIERRKRSNNPVLWKKFEYLYNEMKKKQEEEKNS